MNLIWVCHDLPQGGIKAVCERNVFANQALEHLLGVSDGRVQVQGPWLDDLLPAKRQQLLRQAGRTFRRLCYFLKVLPYRISRADVSEENFPVSRNNRQKVIEIVRYATRKSADTFEFLRLTKLVVKLKAFGDVDGRRNRTWPTINVD